MIRHGSYADTRAFERMFALQGFEYARPDFDDSLLLSKTVMEKDGEVRMAILARLTAEAYFLIDPDFGTPLEKWEAFLELHEAARKDCHLRGLDDIYCWVPPAIERPFGRRLMRLGWERNKWQSFTRSLALPTSDAKKEILCESVT